MRLKLLILACAAATLACSLGSANDKTNNTSPTAIPTSIVFLPTATPTSTPFATATQPQPTAIACVARASWPTVTVQSGDTLFGIALQVGSTVDELAQANCLANANDIVVGQQLHVPNVPPPAPVTATPNITCTAQWFFTFDAGKVDNQATCPNPAITVSAAGEDFEGGRMLWYQAPPGSSDARGTIYAIYNDGTWETYVDTWEAGQPESDPSIVPPTNRIQPIRGIGKVWRDNPLVRQKLGWAYEPEQAFTGRVQEPATQTNYYYIYHGKWGIVLRLHSVNMGPNTWEVAGRY